MGEHRWQGRARRAAALLLAGTIAAGTLAVLPAAAAGAATAPAPPPPAEGSGKPAYGGLSSAELQAEAQAAAAAPAPAPGTAPHGVRVEVHSSLPTDQLEAIVAAAGGTIEGAVPGYLVQATIPADQLDDVEAHAGVDYLQPPLSVDQPQGDTAQPATTASPTAPATAAGSGRGSVVGEQVALTRADAWQAAGITGAGVKVGIIDSFRQDAWDAAVRSGDVPSPAATMCRSNGLSCAIFPVSTVDSLKHGVGVAEVIADMAPGVTLYLGSAGTPADLDAVVRWMVDQHVQVISRSLTWEFDGPGDGTGPAAAVAAYATAHGVTFVNSQGNSGGKEGQRAGSYWRGTWQDTDGDGYLEFNRPGEPVDETLGFSCSYMNGLRWDDWGEGAGATDYDIEVYGPDGTLLNPASTGIGHAYQQRGAPPVELAQVCKAGVNQLKVHLFATGSAAAGDTLEFMVNGAGLDRWQNPYSANQPIADSKDPGVIGVGAVGYDGTKETPFGTLAALYSAQGPTNDGRVKPDLSAPTCVMTTAYATCFNGTSAATPVVSGAAALLLAAGKASTPADLKRLLLASVVDRGAAGADNVYGTGELVLPAPTGTCTDDRYEDNDSLATATPVTSGSVVQGVSCAGEWDDFKVPAAAGSTVTATATVAAGSGAVELYLYKAGGGSPVATYAATTGGGAKVELTVPTTGTWFVGVRGKGGTATSAYTLTTTVTAPVPSDFDGDGQSDRVVFRDGSWITDGGSTATFGRSGDVPVPGQYDDDAATDRAVFTPSTHTFSVEGGRTVSLGSSTDVPVPADYSGDGKVDLAVFSPATGRWTIEGVAGSTAFGTAGDIPVPADYDHDGKVDVAVFRPANGGWYVLGQKTPAVKFGAAGDVPVPADHDGNGTVDLAVFRPSTGRWYVLGRDAVAFGTRGDVPLPGQWDRDAATDLAVFRASTTSWYLLTQPATATRRFGAATDVPVALPWAVYRTVAR